MPNYERDEQYVRIISDIMQNDNFSQMNEIQHHSDTRLNHSLKVSYYSYKIAKAFRAAIISARNDREFNYRDRMSNFPRGCCDDSCDLLTHLLAHYL